MRTGGAVCALLLASAFAAISPAPRAAAQDSGLRGTTADSAPADQDRQALLKRRQARAIAASDDPSSPQDTSAPAYEPISPGVASADPLADPAASLDDSPVSTAPTAEQEAVTARARRAGREAAAQEADQALTQAANRRAATIDSEDRLPLDRGAERTGSIEGGSRAQDQDPFAPVGIRAGGFILRPSIETGIEATSNATSSTGGGSAVLSDTTLRLNATSDWSEHSAIVDGYGTFRKSLSGEDVQEFRGGVDGTLNLDLGKEWRAIAKLGYERAPESASSPVNLPPVSSQPVRQSFSGSLGIEKDIGKMRFGLTGAVEHDDYSDAELSSGGGTLSQKDRNFTLYSATLRGGYEISPALTPFAEVEVGRRVYDEKADANGYERSANRIGARAGVELDLGEKFGGEFSAGWLREALDDNQLDPVSGASVNAKLRWSPERGTNVTLDGSTIVEGTTNPGESGSLLYSGKLGIEREIRANLTANAALGADWRDYMGSDGHDLTLSAEIGATWWMNRYLGITTRARHEQTTSNLADRDSKTNSIFLGVKVQR